MNSNELNKEVSAGEKNTEPVVQTAVSNEASNVSDSDTPLLKVAKEKGEEIYRRWESNVKGLSEKFIKDGRLSTAEANRAVKQYSDQLSKYLDDTFNDRMNEVIHKVLQPTREKIEKLSEKLAKIEKELYKETKASKEEAMKNETANKVK